MSGHLENYVEQYRVDVPVERAVRALEEGGTLYRFVLSQPKSKK